MQRIDSIDYIRGLLAFSVIIYHFMSWSIGVPDSSTTLGRLGIYAVSTFYIISGISLYFVYSELTVTKKDLVDYVIKRVFRIAPLYWIATILTGIYLFLETPNFHLNWEKYLTNITLIFGFYSPRNYVPVGGWSIGNEVVFYALFPLLIVATKRAWAFAFAIALLAILYVYYSNYLLSPANTLAEQWGTYINPLNQAFLFALGVGIGLIRKKRPPIQSKTYVTMFIIACIAFVFWPAHGNQINIVTGINRVMFTLICGVACWSALNANLAVQKHLAKVLRFMGDISYSIYLLHGAAYYYSSKYLLPLAYSTPTAQEMFHFFLLVTVPVTVLFSHIAYKYIEKPFIALGKRLSNHSSPARTEYAPAKQSANSGQ